MAADDWDSLKDIPQRIPTLWFGKYKGVPIWEIPAEYLRWLKYDTTWFSQFDRSLKVTITRNIPKHMRPAAKQHKKPKLPNEHIVKAAYGSKIMDREFDKIVKR